MSEPADVQRKRVRSPSYPSLPLKTALEKAKKLYSAEGRNEAMLAVVMQHWGYSKKSGDGLKAIAALANFGLIDTSGTSNTRKIKLSELALRILLDTRDNSNEKTEAIKKTALQPKIYKKLWNRWGKELPSHGNMRHTLIFEDKFNENFVDDFIKKYKETIEFADLIETGKKHEENQDDEEIEPSEVESTYLDKEISKLGETNEFSTLTVPPNEFEIAKYPVGINSSIILLGKGEITRKSIESLIAQLNLAVELGAFDGLKEN